MILEYNYDKANEVLELFKNSKLATLNIQPQNTEHGVVYLMEYTLIENYVDTKQEKMRQVINESLPERLRIAELINDFIEHQAIGNVREFNLFYNIVDTNKCEVSYTASFGQEYNNVSDIKQLQKCLEWYDTIITKIGVGDLTIPNVVKTNGKNRKNITPITLKDFAGIIRHTLSKEN